MKRAKRMQPPCSFLSFLNIPILPFGWHAYLGEYRLLCLQGRRVGRISNACPCTGAAFLALCKKAEWGCTVVLAPYPRRKKARIPVFGQVTALQTFLLTFLDGAAEKSLFRADLSSSFLCPRLVASKKCSLKSPSFVQRIYNKAWKGENRWLPVRRIADSSLGQRPWWGFACTILLCISDTCVCKEGCGHV